ncbi:MAG: hypothetical protein WBA57_07290 [Elainellaceae cyanobacterium]
MHDPLFSQPFFQPSSSELEHLDAAQLTYDFYREVRDRQEFEAYCQWYYDAAAEHRREVESMRNDINIFGWFLGR